MLLWLRIEAKKGRKKIRDLYERNGSGLGVGVGRAGVFKGTTEKMIEVVKGAWGKGSSRKIGS